MTGTNIKVFIPRDTTSLALGAEKLAVEFTAAAAQCGETVDVVRNGSRGLFWLEPMVEVETPAGRVAYGPVTCADIDSLLEQGMLKGEQTHPLSLGLTEEISYLKK
ncbi:MAG: formate dehydrogenase, partial [Oceanospirillaceae bacterium]|nr:formate dehydrogenase [Oceanospirillaceae bacterium]